MIIVTGGAGFIGSNIIKSLNNLGINDIIVVDNLTDARKVKNLVNLDIQDYFDKTEFRNLISNNFDVKVSAIFHQGACSSTTASDGKYVLDNNYTYSKELLNFSMSKHAQFIYASSASVYGMGISGFQEKTECESPLNAYAFSKLMFDNYVRRIKKNIDIQIVGLRYFNVFGLGEDHKDNMKSTASQFNDQILSTGTCKLFSGTEGYADGEQLRDFISVNDCVKVNLWFYQRQNLSGVFNCGTGRANSFNNMANAVIKWHDRKGIEDASISYVEFPAHLKGKYQNFTQASLDNLRSVGYKDDFEDLETGVYRYLDQLNSKG